MENAQYTVQEFLYIYTDEELIIFAGRILGSQKLNLTIKEAVAVIREKYVYTGPDKN
jgi:hypothetical protein